MALTMVAAMTFAVAPQAEAGGATANVMAATMVRTISAFANF